MIINFTNLILPNQPFNLLAGRLWPIMFSISLLALPLSFILWINLYLNTVYLLSLVFIAVILSSIWWRDVLRESFIGFHTSKLDLSFRLGMLFFISSEVFFFLGFFWAFYDGRLSPRVEMGLSWPPKLIYPLRVYSVPLLNTVILLSSGVSVTWAHHRLICGHFLPSVIALGLTVLLGVYFLFIQYLEYLEASFSITDGIYGRVFFMGTGFHGFHVVVGTIMLINSLYYLARGFLLSRHHFSFEAAAWYWHFVDVVWLFLYVNIYWWGRIV